VSGDLRGELANNTARPFAISPRSSGPGVSIGAGLNVRFEDRRSVAGDYRAVLGEHGATDHRGRIGVNYRF
jgi:outer membrane autotransporter protein